MISLPNNTVPQILIEFSNAVNAEIIDWKLELPMEIGNGYCEGYVFNEHIRMLILDYTLKEDLILKNPDGHNYSKMILFKFKNILQSHDKFLNNKQKMPSVLITTSSIDSDNAIQIHTHTASINIEVNADYLKALFNLSVENHVLQSLLQNTQPLLFEQVLPPNLQEIINEIVLHKVPKSFAIFFLRVKVEELICKLLMELENRSEKRLYNLNAKDIAAIYQVKAQIIGNLNIPPIINELANAANMSATKLQRLFKQIFGSSIFNYYQGYRMKEAAWLLKRGGLAVSEVGYALGFTNLSHFSRVFKEHIGQNPKKYSRI